MNVLEYSRIGQYKAMIEFLGLKPLSVSACNQMVWYGTTIKSSYKHSHQIDVPSAQLLNINDKVISVSIKIQECGMHIN